MKKFLVLISVLLFSFLLKAQHLIINNSGNVMYSSPVSAVDSIKFNGNYSKFKISGNTETLNIQKSVIDSLTFSSSLVNPTKIYIIYNGTDNATIINPYASQGVAISATGGAVTATASSGINNLEYHLLGTSAQGSLTLTTAQPATFVLNNLNLTNPAGPAIAISGAQASTFNLQNGTSNTLSDGTGNTKNGTLQTNGAIIFTGTGNLSLAGVKKHALYSTSTIDIQSGNITVSSAASDSFHSEGYKMSGGSATITSVGDGIDAGDANISITSGTINVTSTSADVKAIKTGTGTINISGGTIGYTVSGAQSKGISAKGNITISGGNITGNVSGIAVLTASGSGFDPSYCTAVKSDGSITISGGTINITVAATSNGGKAFSADGEIIVTNGNITINTAGTNGTYTNVSGVADSFSSAGFSSDTNVNISGGVLNFTVSGADGKGISADGTVNFSNGDLTVINSGAQGKAIKADGNINVTGGIIKATLSGAAVLTASGSGFDSSYSAGLKSTSSVNIDAGTVTITGTSTATGARGIAADMNVNINGGTVTVTTAGNGATYNNVSGVRDSYSASCIKTDGNISVLGGNISLTSTGIAGKVMNADGGITIGSTTGNPTLNIKTTGARLLVSGTDYAHPKTIVANGAIIINNGNTTVNSTDDGIHSDLSITINGGTNTVSAISPTSGVGEGIEAPTITLAGGVNNITASNDGINATYGTVSGGTESNDGSNLFITGGINIVTGNDAIDSNGNITITGGTTIVNGPTSQPEEGIDFNGTFNMNGGYLISAGSNANMTKPMSTTSSQVSLYLKSSAQLAATSLLHIQNAAGTEMVTFKPKNGVYYFHFSSGNLVRNTQYKVYFGGSYTGGNFVGGGTTWGLYTGGTYSTTGATLKSTLTTSNTANVNTVSF